jgi:hypothetical protein
MSFNVKITGLDEFQRKLDEFQKAMHSLDGTIAELRFDPKDPASVQRAVTEIEAAVDRKVAPYREIRSCRKSSKKQNSSTVQAFWNGQRNNNKPGFKSYALPPAARGLKRGRLIVVVRYLRNI